MESLQRMALDEPGETRPIDKREGEIALCHDACVISDEPYAGVGFTGGADDGKAG